MITYKVVGKGTRHCSNWMMYYNSNIVDRKKFLRKYPEFKPFLPRYLKNTIVKSVPHSIGILTFDNIINAKKFIDSTTDPNSCIIVKVKGIELLSRSSIKISCGGIFNLTKQTVMRTAPPQGTLFFKSVKVLE